MNEKEWLKIADTRPMLDHHWREATPRKMRLYATACCRRLTAYFKDERSLRMVEVSEQFADDQLDLEALNTAFAEAAQGQEAVHWEDGDAVDQSSAEAVLGLRDDLDLGQIHEGTMEAFGSLASTADWDKISRPGRPWPEIEREIRDAENRGQYAELAVQADLIRCIFGNPFRPVAFDPQWLTSTVTQLANGIYEDRAFDRMPILADALQDAGCDNDDVLNHCRDPKGIHPRGCWVVDMVLGKE